MHEKHLNLKTLEFYSAQKSMYLLLLFEKDKRYKHMEFVTYFKFHFGFNSPKYFPKGEFDRIHFHFDRKTMKAIDL